MREEKERLVEEIEQLKKDIEKKIIAALDSWSKEDVFNLWQVLHTPEVDEALEKIRYWEAESLAIAPTRVLP
jgi:hypothetical protein